MQKSQNSARTLLNVVELPSHNLATEAVTTTIPTGVVS
jgi:hypothetical protein